jgi:hypothetical protein
MFVTLKVFKLIGPSNDCRRHGRGTYLLLLVIERIMNVIQLAGGDIVSENWSIYNEKKKKYERSRCPKQSLSVSWVSSRYFLAALYKNRRPGLGVALSFFAMS